MKKILFILIISCFIFSCAGPAGQLVDNLKHNPSYITEEKDAFEDLFNQVDFTSKSELHDQLAYRILVSNNDYAIKKLFDAGFDYDFVIPDVGDIADIALMTENSLITRLYLKKAELEKPGLHFFKKGYPLDFKIDNYTVLDYFIIEEDFDLLEKIAEQGEKLVLNPGLFDRLRSQKTFDLMLSSGVSFSSLFKKLSESSRQSGLIVNHLAENTNALLDVLRLGKEMRISKELFLKLPVSYLTIAELAKNGISFQDIFFYEPEDFLIDHPLIQFLKDAYGTEFIKQSGLTAFNILKEAASGLDAKAAWLLAYSKYAAYPDVIAESLETFSSFQLGSLFAEFAAEYFPYNTDVTKAPDDIETHMQTLLLFIKAGLDVNAHTYSYIEEPFTNPLEGTWPLRIALEYNADAAWLQLITAGARPDGVDIYLALKNGRKDIAERFIEAGGDINEEIKIIRWRDDGDEPIEEQIYFDSLTALIMDNNREAVLTALELGAEGRFRWSQNDKGLKRDMTLNAGAVAYIAGQLDMYTEMTSSYGAEHAEGEYRKYLDLYNLRLPVLEVRENSVFNDLDGGEAFIQTLSTVVSGILVSDLKCYTSRSFYEIVENDYEAVGYYLQQNNHIESAIFLPGYKEDTLRFDDVQRNSNFRWALPAIK